MFITRENSCIDQITPLPPSPSKVQGQPLKLPEKVIHGYPYPRNSGMVGSARRQMVEVVTDTQSQPVVFSRVKLTRVKLLHFRECELSRRKQCVSCTALKMRVTSLHARRVRNSVATNHDSNTCGLDGSKAIRHFLLLY